MNRTIKFRAWDEDGIMFIPTKIEFNKLKDGDTWVWNGDIFGQLGSAVVGLMQFTGLKDRNGKEIYEGDIIQPVEGLASEVFWWENHARYACKNSKNRNFPFYLVNQQEVEVIGNIYENPELGYPQVS